MKTPLLTFGYISDAICRGATYIYASLRGWYNTLYMFCSGMKDIFYYLSYYYAEHYNSGISRKLRRSSS